MTEESSKRSKECSRSPVKKTSMGSLISWNVSKALENNPTIDLLAAMKSAQARLEESSNDINAVLSRYPHERHLACALLAWQNLGHRGADSLYSFATSNCSETSSTQKAATESKSGSHDCPSFFCGLASSNVLANKMYDSASAESGPAAGPVVRLPAESVVMPVHQCRYDNQKPPARQQPRKNPKDVKSKIDAACCLSTECADRLSSMDATVAELRMRANKLAKREAQRVELLERAEQAWRDLESGYQRRLRVAEEKEHEIANQTAKLVLLRNEQKAQTTALVEDLKGKTTAAEKERDALAAVEKEMCARACERARQAEQAARSDAALADHLCKASQLDRELLFKEEQSRRKQISMEGAADSAQALVHEAERAMREELAALRDQIGRVGVECNYEDASTAEWRHQLDDLRQERNGLTEDLEGCQLLCDSNMKDQQDELVKKRQQLAEFHRKVMECRCKLPVDASVTVKRTPSLAALCRCTPEDQFGDSCSCTSLRSQLLSNLLADLFGGLQSELGDTGALMPCQLLKCLEDKHNWDRCTPVKTNLRDYFSKLLLGELDIAIATSIEKYHAKWVGASCADKPVKAAMPCEAMHSEDWQARALECKAQKMATKLAEQLFKDKAKELAQQAQDVLAKQGRPPCECHPSSCCPSPPKQIQYTQCDCASGKGCGSRGAAVYQCLVKPPSIGALDLAKNEIAAPKYLRRTLQDVSLLRVQLEELKKNIIKREDLTTLETNIAKMVQLAPVMSPVSSLLEVRELTDTTKKDPKYPRPFKTDTSRNNGISKIINKKKPLEPATNTTKPLRSAFGQFRTKASGKDFKRPTQQFAVNVCLCDAKTKVSTQSKAFQQSKIGSKSSCKQSLSKNNESHLSSKSQAQHIISVTPEISYFDKASTLSPCTEKCICFHKKPSDISINKILDTLTKWRDDLVDLPEKQIIDKKTENPKSIFQISQQIVCNIPDKPHIKIMDDKSIENPELFKLSSQNVKALCDSETLTDSVDKAETSAKTKIVVELATFTESEYMGAINLEKSTEHSCECENNQSDGATCYKNTDNFPFKCINSKKCICKSCISTPIHQEEDLDLQSVQNMVSIHDCNSYLGTETPTKENNYKEVGDVAINAKTSLKSVMCSALFKNDNDNYIKCLGVTLSNVTSQSYLQNRNLKQSISKDNIIFYETHNEAILDSAVQESNAHHDDTECSEPLVRRNCLGVDKSVEIQDLKSGDVLMDEPCMCCPAFGVDCSTDLEVNAFQLLEEHLKGKLNEFKQSVCKSSCIPNSDEEKLFSEILHRVRQIISDSTKTVICECDRNNQVKGSWNRAYGLLYEYLRTKIERVKCQCQSKNEMELEAVLPNVLNNISYLIENDFKRLQEICKCNKSKSCNKAEVNKIGKVKDTLNIAINNRDIIKEVPDVFNVKNAQTFEEHDNDKPPQEDIINLKKLSSLVFNVSAQVSPYHSMETKSCDAMEKTNMNTEVQTTAKNIMIVTRDGFNNTKSVSDSCSKTKNISKNSKPGFDDFLEDSEKTVVDPLLLQKETDLYCICKPSNLKNKESAIQMEIERLFREQTMDTMNKKARNASLSYIGYTMNCCCDTALGCVCTKSTVRAHNDRLKIKNIWKSYTKNNAVLQNVSYMLDSVTDKMPKTVNYVEIREGFYPKLSHEYEPSHRAKSNVCESEINADSEKDIILKESKDSVSMSHVTTNTTSQKRKPKSDTSLECSDYFTTPSTRKSERFSILKRNKKHDAFYPEDSFLRFDNSSDAALVNTSESSTTNCDCKMVPICHVKMLVENIEDKLANAQCTCDSLSSKVCPVHSQRAIY